MPQIKDVIGKLKFATECLNADVRRDDVHSAIGQSIKILEDLDQDSKTDAYEVARFIEKYRMMTEKDLDKLGLEIWDRTHIDYQCASILQEIVTDHIGKDGWMILLKNPGE